MPRVLRHILHVVINGVELSALFVDNVRHVAKELVELADGLFNVADFRLALDDEGVLEIDVVLGRQAEGLLLLGLALG